VLIDQDKELKSAVLNLSVVEKDKLLLKLISKDVVLLEQLRYKLIDSKIGDNNKFEYAKRVIDVYFERLVQYRSDYTSSPGYFMMDMRNLSGAINEYLLVTKDKLGEISLRIYIFEKLLALNLSILKKADKPNQKIINIFSWQDRLHFKPVWQAT
jgi:hypothetical protein